MLHCISLAEIMTNLVIILTFYFLTATAYDSVLSTGEETRDPASQLTAILRSGVSQGIFPGAVALVGSTNAGKAGSSGGFKTLYVGEVGRFTNRSDSPPMKAQGPDETHFDLASVSKVFATTSVIAWLYENDFLSLEDKITSFLGPRFAQEGKAGITVHNCLIHNAGFPPDADPMYWETPFGCPNSQAPAPRPEEDFSCLDRILDSVLAQPLMQPPGTAMNYSDVSFITLGFVAGHLALKHELVDPVTDFNAACRSARVFPEIFTSDSESESVERENENRSVRDATDTSLQAARLMCAHEALFRKRVLQPLGLDDGKTGYLPPQEIHSQCAPTNLDDVYTHKRFQGQVQISKTTNHNESNARKLHGFLFQLHATQTFFPFHSFCLIFFILSCLFIPHIPTCLNESSGLFSILALEVILETVEF
jgi:CubicO group peptidase (beta-lactamase class C family)